MVTETIKRGALIVLEGCDRSGKSTQAKKLVDFWTETRSVPKAKLMRFPDRTTMTGRTIDLYLNQSIELSDEAIHLLFSANRWELARSMERDLTNGITLVVDRYAYSGVAFSAAKGLDFQWCRSPDVGLPEPDCVFFFDIKPDVAVKRGNFGEERYEKLGFQKAVRNVYMQRLREPSWQVIDADQSIDAVFEQLSALALKAAIKAGDRPIGRLWSPPEHPLAPADLPPSSAMSSRSKPKVVGV